MKRLLSWNRMLLVVTGLVAVAVANVDSAQGVQPRDGQYKSFALTILDETGQPVPRAKFMFGGMPAPLGVEKTINDMDAGIGNAETDENGLYIMTFPVNELKDIRCLFFWIDTPGYAPYNGYWNRPEADPIPSEFQVKLEKGTTIGGIIIDKDGNPVADATLMMSIEWENRHRGEVNSNGYHCEVQTNAQGEWRYESLPLTLLKSDEPENFFRISHENFMTTESMHRFAEFLPETNGKFTKTMILVEGVPVKGRVIDENGKPIADALVVGHYRSTMGIARKKTDANGEFLITNWPEHQDFGGINSSYVAVRKPGYKTALESFDISRNRPPVVNFTLNPVGKPIKIKIIDKEGKPVARYMIFIEQWKKSRMIAEDMLTGEEDKHVLTDENGEWTWIEAPDDEVIFDMCDGKHMDLRQNSMKARDEPYVFTVVPGLKISGNVVDAKTGQAIPEFQVFLGAVWNEEYPIEFECVPNVGTNGRYLIDETYPKHYFQVKIEADGYEPSTSRKILSDEGAINVDFNLNKL
ncbi:MAG: carboxypeptidase regulatory-like domain-containing protein [Thermoguttaceae bacterium]